MSLKIMAVDDELEVLKTLKSIIEPLGCEVLPVADSREAARRLTSERFDGLFVDVSMPNIDGFDLSQRARRSELNRDVPIIMLTGQDDVATMRKGFQAGATCFLGKPLSMERIYAVIKAMRGPMLREKRRQVRLPFQTSVRCTAGAKGDQQFTSVSVTISERGVLLGSSGGLQVGQEVDVQFRMAEAPEPLAIHCRVARKELPDRVFLEFLAFRGKDQDAIRRYIAGTVTL